MRDNAPPEWNHLSDVVHACKVSFGSQSVCSWKVDARIMIIMITEIMITIRLLSGRDLWRAIRLCWNSDAHNRALPYLSFSSSSSMAAHRFKSFSFDGSATNASYAAATWGEKASIFLNPCTRSKESLQLPRSIYRIRTRKRLSRKIRPSTWGKYIVVYGHSRMTENTSQTNASRAILLFSGETINHVTVFDSRPGSTSQASNYDHSPSLPVLSTCLSFYAHMDIP